MEFQLPTTEGVRCYPKDFMERWTLLFYYAGDFLPVSATELLGLSGLRQEFDAHRCDLMAVSGDTLPVHLAFLETLSRYRLEDAPPAPLTFPLAADPKGTLRALLQLEEQKKYIWLLRPGGAPEAHFSYPEEVGVNFTEVLRTLLALQTGRPTPYGWVPGAKVLLPPPTTRSQSCRFETESERSGHTCIDWYLCFENPAESP